MVGAGLGVTVDVCAGVAVGVDVGVLGRVGHDKEDGIQSDILTDIFGVGVVVDVSVRTTSWLG